ncbi:MAG: YafY family transcriptional regulator [Myxococcales bacterium]|nr:YafY family transcriptional regulator [Myxococcales bacterium]
MARSTPRILSALELLQARERMTGAELAAQLGVDRRTVRRYMTALEELGVPIGAERGRDGAYFLVAGYKVPPMMFSEEEALVLSLGLLAARSLGLTSASAATATAQAKLERVMPARLKRRARAIHETVALEPARQRPEPLIDGSVLEHLSQAAQQRTRVRVRYQPASGQGSERELDPYGLGFRGGRWYVVGWCHQRAALRSFRVDRIRHLEPLQASFERPAGFDVMRHLTTSIASLPRAQTIEVWLDTSEDVARQELFPAAGVLEQTAAGLVLHSQADDLAWFARELARLPFRFQILRPVALTRALVAHARRLTAAPRRRAARKSLT